MQHETTRHDPLGKPGRNSLHFLKNAKESHKSGLFRATAHDNNSVLEITAYHEAGHVWAALHYGAKVLRVTIEPEWDDGPLRHGDTQVAWPVADMGQRDFHRKSVLVTLAGPVAEMIHTDQPNDVQAVAEWQADWQVAWAAAAPLAPAHTPRLGLLERCSNELFQLLNVAAHWRELATIVDHLLAHGTLDQDMITDIFGRR